MSGFLSSEAERALQGEEEGARRLFDSDALNHPPPPGHPAYQGQQHVPIVPSQPWPPMYSPGPSNQVQVPSFSGPRSSPYAAEDYLNTSRSSLHPGDIFESSSQLSRSPSPGNQSDLPNFGYSLGDGTSWKCAYPGCSFHAVFTRGCDLREGTRRPCSAVSRVVRQPPRGASRARKTAIDTKRSIDRTFLASCKGAIESSVESIT